MNTRPGKKCIFIVCSTYAVFKHTESALVDELRGESFSPYYLAGIHINDVKFEWLDYRCWDRIIRGRRNVEDIFLIENTNILTCEYLRALLDIYGHLSYYEVVTTGPHKVGREFAYTCWSLRERRIDEVRGNVQS